MTTVDGCAFNYLAGDECDAAVAVNAASVAAARARVAQWTPAPCPPRRHRATLVHVEPRRKPDSGDSDGSATVAAITCWALAWPAFIAFEIWKGTR